MVVAFICGYLRLFAFICVAFFDPPRCVPPPPFAVCHGQAGDGQHRVQPAQPNGHSAVPAVLPSGVCCVGVGGTVTVACACLRALFCGGTGAVPAALPTDMC